MKIKLLVSVLLFSSSLSLASTTPHDKGVCVKYQSEYTTTGDKILESSIVTDLNPLKKLDPTLPVKVTYFYNKCSSNMNTFSTVVENPQPDMPQIGDTRVMEQTRGNQVTKYFQEYRESGWWTTRTETDYLDVPPADPV